MRTQAKDLLSYPTYWAECFGIAPYLPMSRTEMNELGWDSCDIILVTGDAYIDHPSFGMAVMGRLLEAQGFRVGIISQPDWQNTDDFMQLGEPNLYFGVTAGNMDSLINRYTADLRLRSNDAYTPNGEAGKRPDRSVIVYSQRIKEAYKDTPIVIGGIEASLRRIAHYDYWSDKVRKSILIDSSADILLFGNAERAIVELTHQLSRGAKISELETIRGTAIIREQMPDDWTEIDSSRIDWPSSWPKDYEPFKNPYDYDHNPTTNKECASKNEAAKKNAEAVKEIKIIPMPLASKQNLDRDKTYIRLPSFEKVRNDSALYAHTSRILHLESNPHNARPLVQRHGTKDILINLPPIPLSTEEMDAVFALPYQRKPHPSYGDAKIPSYDMIKFSVNIMRGCFGGCTFCSITEHEGRIIQSRSQESVLKEVEEIRDKVPGFTGTISDLGGPTANMYHLNCKDDDIQANCRRLSCVYPTVCKNLKTDHSETTSLYRKARKIKGVKRVMVASGLRYDLAVKDPEYVKELVTHHVGGYLKIAPEHSEKNVLSKMMKPGMGTYDEFKQMFERFSKEAGKKQYLIPYFIAAHPGSENEDMLSLAMWLKKNDFKLDQVQTFYPSPMAMATAMYHSEKNPLKKIRYKSEKVFIPKELEHRRLQKAFLRYHDPNNWDVIRAALKEMNKSELIGDGENQLVPAPENTRKANYNKNRSKTGRRKKPTRR
ncbi:MAG: YgiQ family radical SAM protein [Gammaproteobacteria bacterium]|jgi:uncharacterized radical SAM protein YgiQ